ETNVILGNFIGTNDTGTIALANAGDGIDVLGGAASNTIGGTAAGSQNVIAGNTGEGVYIGGSATSSNLVQGNYVGVGLDGTTLIGNAGGGIHVGNAASDNTIGGSASGAGNLINANGLDGVVVDDADGSGNFTGTAAVGI